MRIYTGRVVVVVVGARVVEVLVVVSFWVDEVEVDVSVVTICMVDMERLRLDELVWTSAGVVSKAINNLRFDGVYGQSMKFTYAIFICQNWRIFRHL